MSDNRNILYRKICLFETPLIYVENRDELPDWKRYMLANDDYRFNLLLQNNIQKKYDQIKKEYGEAFVRASADLNLKSLKHTYHREDNSISISREQELENDENMFNRFIYDEWNIKEMYIERELGGAVWSYFLNQEISASGTRKRIEGVRNHATNLRYIYVNADFSRTYQNSSTITINSSEYPEYMISDVHGKNTFIISANMLYYHYYDHICERDGRLIYYVVGSHEEKEFPARFKEPVLKSIEYLEKEKSYRLDITSDTAPAQIKKKLNALLKSEDVSVIRITGGEHNAETLIYGTEEKYFIAVRDDTGIRYSVRATFDLSFVHEFGITIPAMCVVKYPLRIEDFIENIICSDYGYNLLAWAYFYDEQLQFDFPEPDFSQAAAIRFPKSKAKKPQVVCTEFTYETNRSARSLDEDKLANMTSRKMYNLAVKKLETGTLSRLFIGAACNDELQKTLVLYGNGTFFSIGIISENETTLCYDNDTDDKELTCLGGQDFPNTMITGDMQLLKNIIKCFCDQCLPLGSVNWIRS